MQKSGQLIFRLLVLAFPFLAASSRSPKITGLALVFGNLLPLIGVMFFDWSVMEILWIYWAESAIIGLINVISMHLAATHEMDGTFDPMGFLAAVPLSAFFCAHFGGFMFGHAVFLGVLPQIAEAAGLPGGGGNSVDILAGPGAMLVLFGCPPDRACESGDIFASPIFAGVAALVASHGVSFYVHFLKEREYYRHEVMQLFVSPYKRIVVMHLTIILGVLPLGALSVFYPQYATGGLAGAWVAIKIVMDLRAHWHAHEIQPAQSVTHPAESA